MPVIGRFRYLDAPACGERPLGTLVLVHAFPLNARMWQPQMGLNAHGWHVVAPQLRGFDGGMGELPVTSIDDYAGDVIDLLDALHLHDVVLGGLSMGGYVAFAVLRHAASRIRGLVLADTRAEADTPEAVAGRQRMLALLADKGPASVADEMVPKLLAASTRTASPAIEAHVRDLILASQPDAIAGAIRALMTRPDATPQLSAIHCPTLIVVGAQDTVTPPSLSEGMHGAIAGSELAVIPEAGHLSNLERPDAFNAALATFLRHRL